MEAFEYCSNPGCENHLEGGHSPECRMCHIEQMREDGFVLIPTADCARSGAWEYVKPYPVGSRVRIENRSGKVGINDALYYIGYIWSKPTPDRYTYTVIMSDDRVRSALHYSLKVVG